MRAIKLLVGTSARVQSETSAIGNGDNRPRCHLRKCVKLELCFHRRLDSADAVRANSEKMFRTNHLPWFQLKVFPFNGLFPSF